MAIPFLSYRANASLKLPKELWNQAINAQVLEQVNQKLQQAYNGTLQLIQEEVLAALNESRIAQALLDEATNHAEDLRAHFGLTSEAAQAGWDAILETVVGTVVGITPKQVRGARTFSLAVQFQWLTPGYRQVLAELPEGKYISHSSQGADIDGGRAVVPKNTEIEWIKWLILYDGHPTTIDDAGIYFDLTPAQALRSRSQRALMSENAARLQARQDSIFPWTVPDIVLPIRPGSEDFIQDVLGSSLFKSHVGLLMERTIRKALGNTPYPKGK